MKKFIFGLSAITVIIAGIFTFAGCEKEENTLPNTISDKIIKSERAWSDTLYVVQIHWGVKGKGFGHNKTCVNGRGGCWNWFSSTIDTTADVIISVDWDLSIHPHVVAIAQTDEPNSPTFPKNITLEFPDTWNEPAMLNEVFDLNNMTLTLEEDVVEGGYSPMLDMLGTTQNCRIPAGIYSVTRNERGNITVILPAFTL